MILLRARFALGLGALLIGAASLAGCDDEALAPRPVDAGIPFGLTPEQASAVVAKVGDRTITLGDYALLLERMNNIDQSRYQSKKRRRDLLQEMIDIELLAQEARRRGLDQNPEVQNAIRQVLRDAMRSKIHSTVRAPGRIPQEEVKAYYDANIDDFREPERRKVSAIVLGDPEKAKDVLEKALAIQNDQQWGELFFEHSLTAPEKRKPTDPTDQGGFLDMVGPPGDVKGASSKVPTPVRKAVYELDKVGDIHDAVVEAAGRYYIVRMTGLVKAHTRTFENSERAIRMKIFQKEQRDAEEKVVGELRKQLTINVDKSAVAAIKLPAALASYKPFWDEPAPSSEPEPAPSVAPSPTAAPSAKPDGQ